jgi:hypothetical protein
MPQTRFFSPRRKTTFEYIIISDIKMGAKLVEPFEKAREMANGYNSDQSERRGKTIKSCGLCSAFCK